jgi:hypothetical protein
MIPIMSNLDKTLEDQLEEAMKLLELPQELEEITIFGLKLKSKVRKGRGV